MYAWSAEYWVARELFSWILNVMPVVSIVPQIKERDTRYSLMILPFDAKNTGSPSSPVQRL
jgi:hypothetical protein